MKCTKKYLFAFPKVDVYTLAVFGCSFAPTFQFVEKHIYLFIAHATVLVHEGAGRITT